MQLREWNGYGCHYYQKGTRWYYANIAYNVIIGSFLWFFILTNGHLGVAIIIIITTGEVIVIIDDGMEGRWDHFCIIASERKK